MLHVNCEEYLRKVEEFAKSKGIYDKLKNRLDYLDTYAEHGDRGKTVCELYNDFAPNSFYFVMTKRKQPVQHNHNAPIEYSLIPKKIDNPLYERWFNGGLIYYGAGEDGVSMPQLSVRLTGNDETWTINT